MFQKPCYISKKVSALYGEGEGCLYFRGFQRVPSDRGVFGCFRAGAWIHIAFVQGFVLTHLWRICITVFVLVRRFCYTEHGGVSCSQVLFAQFFLVLKQVFLSFKPSRSVCLLYSGYVFIVLWNFFQSLSQYPTLHRTRNHNLNVTPGNTILCRVFLCS